MSVLKVALNMTTMAFLELAHRARGILREKTCFVPCFTIESLHLELNDAPSPAVSHRRLPHSDAGGRPPRVRQLAGRHDVGLQLWSWTVRCTTPATPYGCTRRRRRRHVAPASDQSEQQFDSASASASPVPRQQVNELRPLATRRGAFPACVQQAERASTNVVVHGRGWWPKCGCPPQPRHAPRPPAGADAGSQLVCALFPRRYLHRLLAPRRRRLLSLSAHSLH